MGGVQALNVSLTHPGFFAYIGVFRYFGQGWFPQVQGRFEQINQASLRSPDKSKVKLFLVWSRQI